MQAFRRGGYWGGVLTSGLALLGILNRAYPNLFEAKHFLLALLDAYRSAWSPLFLLAEEFWSVSLPDNFELFISAYALLLFATAFRADSSKHFTSLLIASVIGFVIWMFYSGYYFGDAISESTIEKTSAWAFVILLAGYNWLMLIQPALVVITKRPPGPFRKTGADGTSDNEISFYAAILRTTIRMYLEIIGASIAILGGTWFL